MSLLIVDVHLIKNVTINEVIKLLLLLLLHITIGT